MNTPQALRIHVIPIGDSKLHAGQTVCWCHPLDAGDNVWVHNAADCREAQERQGVIRTLGWTNVIEYSTPTPHHENNSPV